MSIEIKNKNLIFSLIPVLITILCCKTVIAPGVAPTFDQLSDGDFLILSEDVEFIYIVNATDADGDYPLLFSDDSENKLAVFNMVNLNSSSNNRAAVINFTPLESDVLDLNSDISNYHITLIVKDNGTLVRTTAIDVLFNITNSNDPPNITSFTPAYISISENASIVFSFDNNTADPDLMHPGEDYITNAWYLNGTNKSTNISWTYEPGFCDSGTYNLSLVVNDSYKNSTLVSRIFTVDNTNRPPVNNATIQNATWQEDNNITNNITLKGYFNDSDQAECSGSNKDNLTYGHVSYSVTNSINSSKHVNVVIDQTTGNVSFYVEENWFGVEVIAFYANDSYNITYSNNVTLNVTNINDAPIIPSIDNQTAIIDRAFTLQVQATDPDNDTIYFYSNSSLIAINLTTGLIGFTPTADDIANYTVNITVNDSLLQDSRIIMFSIINNTPPILDPIGDKNATKNTLFGLNLTATDADGDNLTFTSNTTMFTIIWYNNSMSQISFTPTLSDVGNHSINFTVTDMSGDSDSEIITLSINDTNTAPTLNRSIENRTWRQDTNLTDNLTLSEYFHDPEGDNLTYNVTGNVNIRITITQNTSNVSFIPAPGWFGVEYVRFSANDSYYKTFSNNITLNVTPNSPPEINNIYPYGDGTNIIYGWISPPLYPNGTSFNINENTTLSFKQNTSDADNDALTYQWLLNGSLINTTQNVTFYFNFTTAGMKNLTVTASDGLNTTSFRWNINVTNVNRPPTFGIKKYTSYSNFAGGTLNNTNITAQAGNITLAQSGGAYLNGTYTSPAINMVAAANKLNFTYISWASYLPSGTNITLKTRTASTSSGLSSSNWSRTYTNSSKSMINSTNNQYIQFMADLTTTDNTHTPVLEEVSINYEIDTPTLLEDYTYESWVDLDNYFEDLDIDDNVIFNHSEVSNVIISIDQSDHTVRLSFDANWYGTRTFNFLANDSYSSVYSNNITIVVEDVTDETTTSTSTSGGGGGGSGARAKVKNVPEYEYVRLLVPGPISMVDATKVRIPIIVENSLGYPLKGIYLSANSDEAVSLEFDASFIGELDSNDQTIVHLFATSTGEIKPYTITVNAKVTTPSLNDSTLIQINPLENITIRVKSVMDMLKTNPECLELNELVVNAQRAISNKEYEKANNLLEEVIRSCRYIIAKKEEEKREEMFSPKLNLWLWAAPILLLFAAIASFYLVKRKKTKTNRKKKEER